MGDGTILGLLNGLRPEEPRPRGLRVAAVAMVFRDVPEPSLLLIKRAVRPDDPWSGQVAFPGGKMQPGDATAMGTAVRETMEEVGIDLGKGSRFLGYSEATPTHTGTIEVVPCVFLLSGDPRVRPNGEVASHRWVELSSLLSSEARWTYPLKRGEDEVDLPALRVGDYVVWGLTHRIMSSVLPAIGGAP